MTPRNCFADNPLPLHVRLYIHQSLWCLSFRVWARDAGLLWLPALMLGGTAVTLGGGHAVLREAWFARDIELPQYLAAHLPLRCVTVPCVCGGSERVREDQGTGHWMCSTLKKRYIMTSTSVF